MVSDPVVWTTEAASEWLKNVLSTELEENSEQPLRRALLLRYSVLARFALTGFQVDDGSMMPETRVQAALDKDLVTLPRIPGEPQWFTLKPTSRAEGLRELSTLEEMYAERQRSIVDDPTPLQIVFDEYLERNYSAAVADEVQRLEAALQVTTWLEPFIQGAPQKGGIERRLAIRRLLYPMERLTQGFMGRGSELSTLRSFVGVLDPQSRAEAVRRFLSGFTATRNPLMLYGIGGVGKSTLLTEFIRQHVSGPMPFPWVYLDFDNPRLNVAILSTLVEEAVEQLGAQYIGSDWSGVLAEARTQSNLTEAAHYQSEQESRSIAFGDLAYSEYQREQSAQLIAQSFASQLKMALESTGLERMMQVSEMLPLLIVMDTFEEVQKRGIETAGILWKFLTYLQQNFPRLRVVVSGRAQVPEVGQNLGTPVEIALREFDESSAISYLMVRGVSDIDSARALYKQVGGNPLNLKLAAQVAKNEKVGKKGIEGIKTTSYLVFAAAEHVVQGQLYSRILERITDPDLHKLAHPGLVVRRVTPTIIQQVLAGPCELGEIDLDRASQLFEKLKCQVDLVVLEPDGAVRHQQDVRRVMLKLLESEKPDQVHAIHELAYQFYRGQTGTTAAIERIYHALQLSKDDSEILNMWIPEATESMRSSVEEFPPSSQLIVYLQAKEQPSAELRALASLEQWERLVESRARQAIEYGEFTQVIKILAERADRTPGSALYAIAATASMHIGDIVTARSQLEEGIASAESINRLDRLCELWRLSGELYRDTGELDAADEAFSQAQKLAMRMGSGALALQIYTSRANLSLPNSKQTTEAPPDTTELIEILKATSDADFASVRSQLVGLFRLCGETCVPLLVKGLRVLKLEYLPYLQPQPPWITEAREMQGKGRLNEFFQQRLESFPEDLSMRAAVASVLEESLDPNRSARLA